MGECYILTTNRVILGEEFIYFEILDLKKKLFKRRTRTKSAALMEDLLYTHNTAFGKEHISLKKF